MTLNPLGKSLFSHLEQHPEVITLFNEMPSLPQRDILESLSCYFAKPENLSGALELNLVLWLDHNTTTCNIHPVPLKQVQDAFTSALKDFRNLPMVDLFIKSFRVPLK